MNREALNFEIKRKIFHILALVFPCVYLFIEKRFAVPILFFLASAVLCFDISRRYNSKIKASVDKIFSRLMRPRELGAAPGLSGASFLFWGFFFSAAFFSKKYAIVSWIVFIISDASAALVGTAFGEKRLSCGKSLEGFAACFFAALITSFALYFFYGFEADVFSITVASFLISLLELFSKKILIDDNLLAPSAYCFFIYIFTDFYIRSF